MYYNTADEIPAQLLIDSYNELKSSYKVAAKFNVSATAVKRILKELRVLRTQKVAALEREPRDIKPFTEEHKKNLSKAAIEGYKSGKRIPPWKGKKLPEHIKQAVGKAAKERSGKRNPNYKNGKYLRRPRDYKIHELTKLRNVAFNRDKYICQICKEKSPHLHAHHLIPYWVNNDAFTDVDNLLTVCTKCHFSKAHLGNWACFDSNLIPDSLVKKYNLCRERLSELGLAAKSKTCNSLDSANN